MQGFAPGFCFQFLLTFLESNYNAKIAFGIPTSKILCLSKCLMLSPAENFFLRMTVWVRHRILTVLH
ncbi:hypothetical protein Dip510_000534 [Elusimicrobium posterum]